MGKFTKQQVYIPTVGEVGWGESTNSNFYTLSNTIEQIKAINKQIEILKQSLTENDTADDDQKAIINSKILSLQNTIDNFNRILSAQISDLKDKVGAIDTTESNHALNADIAIKAGTADRTVGTLSINGTKFNGSKNTSVTLSTREDFDNLNNTVISSVQALSSRITDLESLEFKIEVVDVLPEKGRAQTLYFVPKKLGKTTNNVYDEYVWTGSVFELVGDTEAKLQNFYTIDQTDALYMSLTKDQTINGNKTFTDTVSAEIHGNSSTANKLKTPIQINGTYFDGSKAITTYSWGAPRTISITDGENSTSTITSGSEDITLQLPTTIKANVVGNIIGDINGSCDSATSNQNGFVLSDDIIKSLSANNDTLVYYGINNISHSITFNNINNAYNADKVKTQSNADYYLNCNYDNDTFSLNCKSYTDDSELPITVRNSQYATNNLNGYNLTNNIVKNLTVSNNTLTATELDNTTYDLVINNVSHASSSDTSTKATNNLNGYSLADSIIKGLTVSNNTLTVTCIDGSAASLVINNVVHSTNADNATNANHANHANQANKLAKSVNIGLSGAVQGSASFNGANDITIETTTDLEDKIINNMVGDAKEGQVLSAIFDTTKNQNVVKSYPLIDFCKIVTTTDTLNQLKLVPVGMSTIFSEWHRFSHWRSEQNLSGNTGHKMPNNTYSGVEHAAARNGWTYDKSTNMIKSNRNSPVYAGFINPLKLKQWYLKVQIYGGGDGDNDGILINVAFMKDSNGVEHTIDLVRARSGVGNGVYLDDKKGMEFYWSLVYDYRQDTQKELANNHNVYCAPTNIPQYGWGTNYACMSCYRNVTNIKCYTSDVVSTPITTVNENSIIDYTLPSSKPSGWSDAMWSNMQTMLLNASQMGVGAHSQNGLFTILEQRYIFNDEKLYDMINDIIWEYSEKTNNWNNVGKCSASLREGQIYYNESTKQTFYYTNGNAYCIGNGN